MRIASGKGVDGRVYTITLTCRDASANPASQMPIVHVPKSH